MKQIKGIPLFLMAAFLGTVLAIQAQDSGTPPETSTESAPAETKPPVKKAAKKPAKKKKKPAPEPASEYKFNQIDSVATYKFDKQNNPIIKAVPKKKTAKKAAVKKAGAPQSAPKLKKQPPMDDSGQVKQGELPQAPPQQPTGD